MKWIIVILNSNGGVLQTTGPFASKGLADGYRDLYYPDNGVVVPNIEVI